MLCLSGFELYSRWVPLITAKWQYNVYILKADLDGTILAYDYRARLANVMTFDHPHAHNFHFRHVVAV